MMCASTSALSAILRVRKFVQAAHTVNIEQGLPDRLDFLRVQPGIDEFSHRFQGQLASHVRDHHTHHRGCDQIKEGITQQIAGHPDDDHQ